MRVHRSLAERRRVHELHEHYRMGDVGRHVSSSLFLLPLLLPACSLWSTDREEKRCVQNNLPTKSFPDLAAEFGNEGLAQEMARKNNVGLKLLSLANSGERSSRSPFLPSSCPVCFHTSSLTEPRSANMYIVILIAAFELSAYFAKDSTTTCMDIQSLTWNMRCLEGEYPFACSCSPNAD